MKKRGCIVGNERSKGMELEEVCDLMEGRLKGLHFLLDPTLIGNDVPGKSVLQRLQELGGD